MDAGNVNPNPGVPEVSRAVNRFDPFWDGMWASGSYAAWTSAMTARAQEDAGLARVRGRWGMSPGEAWDIITGDLFRPVILHMLGATLSWRTLTAQQLAAFTGYASLAGRSDLTRAAFAASMLDVGVFTSVLLRSSPDSPASAFRPTRSRVLERDFLPTLTYPERVLLTGGRRVLAGGQYDRHNILSAELGLRAAEMTDVSAVLGETMSTVDLLVGSGLGRAPMKDVRSADLTLVRGDGLRVAVELTASTAPGFQKKVHRWAKVLAQNTLETSGLVVLFVAAPPRDRALGRAVTGEVRKTLSTILRDYPGSPGKRPGDRIFYADWTDWFPARHQVDDSFLTLRAQLAPYTPGSGWRDVDLLDPFDFPFNPVHPDRLTAVIGNAAALGGSPLWLRSDASPLWHVAVDRTGASPVVPPGRNKQGRHGGRLGAAKGAAGRAGVPAPLMPGPHVPSNVAVPSRPVMWST